MHPPKSRRHVKAANARWRMVVPAELPPLPDEIRQPFTLPFAHLGYRDLRIEPRLGYVAWRAVDVASGETLHCAALKELLRWIAAELPRMLAARNYLQ